MRRRIIICLGLLLAICALGDAVAMLGLYRSTTDLAALVDYQRIQSMRANLASAAIRVESDLVASLSARKDSTGHPAIVTKFRSALTACSACHHEPAVQAMHDHLQATTARYDALQTKLLSRNRPDADPALEQETLAVADQLTREAVGMADLAGGHLRARHANVSASLRLVWIVLTVTLVALLGVGFAVALHLKNRLTIPVAALLKGMRQFRRGDASARVEVVGDEEFRVLADALNQAQADLRRAHAGMLQAEKMAAVGRLASGVAHEVGNPLASISSIAQMMRRKDHDGKAHERSVELILEQVTRISRIVRDLLDFSRPATAERRIPVNVADVLKHAASLLAYDKRMEGVRLECAPDEDLPLVRADTDRLMLVFTNIMINALDAMHGVSEDGSGTLTLTARHAGDRVVVRFTDDGPGMTPEQIANAFEPFYTTKEPGAGTGLGLWICYQIVQRYGGRLAIDSRAGAGTTLIVELPCEPSAEPVPAGASPAPAPPADVPSGN